LATHAIIVALQAMSGRVHSFESVPASQICTLGSSPHVAIVLDPTKMACLTALSLWTVAILNSVKHGDKNDDNGEEWEGRMGMVDASLPIL